ncbi:hypothetical protein K491DRAFT_699835 [Lophiostoma macrostomum CBS 122681]|uniref:Trichome differentiation protein GL1 n=1 Tax=Lophiostoma macrostomum CBS 122681 TaxID=1314788 RepID=A0A6A6SH64_9PLEO|nr:hypothetical protein K491DRAFT_699835 [Lophiostoma macrostomum CBS 122681]
MVNHHRSSWSQGEENRLINLVHQNGPQNWVRISQEIGTRSPKQCRERYHRVLKPSLNRDPITPEEGEQIERMVAEMGKKWVAIARRLSGRSDNAVRNWWNGRHTMRIRNSERQDSRSHEQAQSAQAAYHCATAQHGTEPGISQHSLPSVRDYAESSPYYSQSRRPVLNPPMHSPHALKLPQPPAYDLYPGPPSQPLKLPPLASHSAFRSRGFTTSIPSYSFSVAFYKAPVTDTGSESRLLRGAPSPLDRGLPPMIGSRDEWRNSSTWSLTARGVVSKDDDHSGSYDPLHRRTSVQLPPLQRPEPASRAPFFQEPNYGSERPQLLTQPASLLMHHHSLPQSAKSSTISSVQRQLPSPFARPAQAGESRSAPTSPRNVTPRDEG